MSASQIHKSCVPRKKLIYILEDDSVINSLYHITFSEKYDLKFFRSSNAFFDALKPPAPQPDLALIDMQLDDGYFLDAIMDKPKLEFPFFVISCFSEINEIKSLFEYGAVDYLVKPFSFDVLGVKIERTLDAVARKNAISFSVDYKMGLIKTNDDDNIALTPKETQILAHLLDAANFKMSKYDLYMRIWGGAPDSIKNRAKTVEVHIRNLQRKVVHTGYNLLITDDHQYQLQKIEGLGT